ncbi:MAG: peptide chain release factor N(5)-glutamine methyltransferase [Rhodobacteraceae bacterium]|nr:peptide chain release factor N(5)-glutamine methyltransferase [Paracoccaceae bacterium]
MIKNSGLQNNRPARLDDLLRAAVARLHAAGAPDPVRDTRILARWAVNLSAAAMAAEPDQGVSPEAAARFEAAVAAREARRPVSHIVGGREFYGRWFEVDGHVLDPRPESETLVEAALAELPQSQPRRVLDLGVGSGCLLLSVLAERPASSGLGVDQSVEALAVAQRNAAALGLAARAALRQGDWLSGVDERFNVILCNPPYISETEFQELTPEVSRYEPLAALTPGGDGLSAYRTVIPGLAEVLSPGGAALFEVGRGQAEAVAEMLSEAGFASRQLPDLNGVARVVRGTR